MPQSSTDIFSGIFISYRRDDCPGHAGRLFDRLVAHFGSDQIFMDVDSIEPGEDFVDVLENAVGSCAILIAMIGSDWLTAAEEKSWKENVSDYVRLEIGTALRRNVRVIPVLVQGATMPRPDQLPEGLVTLTRKNSIELSDIRWRRDVDQLISHLEKVLGRPPAKREDAVSVTGEANASDGLSRKIRRTVQITVGLLLAVALAALIWTQVLWKQKPTENRNSATPSPSIRPQDLTPEESVKRARQLSEEKKYVQAEPYWRAAVAHDPFNADHNYQLGITLYSQEKYAEAEPFLRQARALNSGDAQYNADLGNVLKSQAKYAEAEPAHREAVRLSPNNIHYIDALAIDLYFQGKHAEAELWFRKALRINPADAEIRNSLGNALYDQKKYAEAKTHYEKAKHLQPNNPYFQTNVEKVARALSKVQPQPPNP